MKKFTAIMSVDYYFLIKDYLIQLYQQGAFDKDVYLMKFYKSFAIDASIEIDRHNKDNSVSSIVFYLDDTHTMLVAVGLFCREHSLDLKTKNLELSMALQYLKDFFVTELFNILDL